jgi:hypothetical protein
VKKLLSFHDVIKFSSELFGGTIHSKRIESMSAAIFGITRAERLTSSSIGRALATSTGRLPKHCIKQVDRLLGNEKFVVDDCITVLIPWIIGQRKQIVVSLDWTEYGYVDQHRIAINLITNHGRATPLLWKTVDGSKLKNRRNKYEKEVLNALSECLSPDISVTVIADRGFANTSFFKYIEEHLQWDYVIRLRKNTYMGTEEGCKKSLEYVATNGRILEYNAVTLTNSKKAQIKSVVTVKKQGMKEAWILASTISNKKQLVVDLYSRRFTCEENFRDEKDDRFGLGSKETLVSTVERRDRLCLLNMVATILCTILGIAGERSGYLRYLKANTVSTRTHSYFRQGREYVKGVANRFIDEIIRLFYTLLKNQRVTRVVYGQI